MIYLAIFISKIIENALATLRIILVSNGKKQLGAIIQGLVTLVWILVTGYVIIDVNKDIFKIIVFCLGAIAGSYLGSVIEEKIALGYVKINIYSKKYTEISHIMKNNFIKFNLNNHNISLITKRRNIPRITNNIHQIDNNAIIISERIKIYGKITI